MYTSKKLSKWLKEKGFEGESEDYYEEVTLKWNTRGNKISKKSSRKFNKYDILNDLCSRYAKEVFGGKSIGNIMVIIDMMQQNKPQEEIEEYIMENSILNK